MLYLLQISSKGGGSLSEKIKKGEDKAKFTLWEAETAYKITHQNPESGSKSNNGNGLGGGFKIPLGKDVKHVRNGKPHEDHLWGGVEVYKYHRSDLERDSEVYIPASVKGIWKHNKPSLYDVGVPMAQKSGPEKWWQPEAEVKKQLNGMPLDVAPAPLNPPNYESTAVGDGEMES